jgi:hypothetical protein
VSFDSFLIDKLCTELKAKNFKRTDLNVWFYSYSNGRWIKIIGYPNHAVVNFNDEKVSKQPIQRLLEGLSKFNG